MNDTWEHRKVTLLLDYEIQETIRRMYISGNISQLGGSSAFPEKMELILKRSPEGDRFMKYW